MPSLANLDMCTGCSACVSICPKGCLIMKKDQNGFFIPKLLHQKKCVNCGQCENVCPVLKQKNMPEQDTQVFAAYVASQEIREESSSGGIFTLLAELTLAARGVVYGAAYQEDFSVQHIAVTMPDELHKLRGAKYVQSDMGNIFTIIQAQLNDGQEVLFSGTPCQVAGLKSFLRKEYSNLVCVDFICHGIPSPVAWENYVQYRSIKDSEGSLPVKINLRSKHTGWSNYQYSNLYEYENGFKYSAKSDSDLFMKLFVGDYINRGSCSTCKFKGYNRNSDLTLGDFWGIWEFDSDMDDNRGTSLVMLHSQKARDLMNRIEPKIKMKEMTLEQASQWNPSMLYSSPAKIEREKVLEKVRDGKFDELENFLIVPEKSGLFSNIKQKIKKIIGKGW